LFLDFHVDLTFELLVCFYIVNRRKVSMSRGLESGIGQGAKGAFEGVSNALSEVLKHQSGGGSPSSSPGGDAGSGKSASAGMGDVFDFAKAADIYA
jgi:hypothetical protein